MLKKKKKKKKTQKKDIKLVDLILAQEEIYVIVNNKNKHVLYSFGKHLLLYAPDCFGNTNAYGTVIQGVA